MQHDISEKAKFDAEEDLSPEKSLVFKLGKELYGCSVLRIKEVIKVGAIKQVPYMAHYFRGVLNLRGKVIGVVDLGAMLSIETNQSDKQLIVVTETKYGVIGVLVDELVSVSEFPEINQGVTGSINSKITPEFFLGIGKWNERLVHLIDLSGLVQEEDFRIPVA